ncbi:NAD(P)/FAD-dependent oxidoreductase [Phycicoccus flavus]|uniref:FAD-dependent oxidoreductase n=1 Tax=Phycicoccus flavus TaxID=2502783 RepID=A0A8T6QZ38_9MICO|nr:FAD-dependent oxidoreductase [Phycicoccus flavus]NHA67198.1 FAD-dependent oxidoreductase [Phycicoccus flavus]
MESPRFVVVGGGPAAAGAARRFAEAGHPVAVLTAEPVPPYDRTVLSKDVLLDPAAPVPALWPTGAPWLDLVFCRPRTLVEALDPGAGVLTTDDGTTWAFDRVVLATGAEPRRLLVPGADGPGVLHLRDTRDAAAVSAALVPGSRVVVVGGGVIGLEVAAAARARGALVEVVEAGPRVLGRAVPSAVAAWLARAHAERGVVIRPGTAPQEVLRDDAGRVRGVHLSDDTVLPADAVVVGIGVSPRDGLARAAGIEVDDGILVDAAMRTSHPSVLAAGDVVRRRGPGPHGVRLESYTAAGRQGAVAAGVALGSDEVFDDVPWTWSDQGDLTMQTTGTPPPGAEEVLVGGPDTPVVLSLLDGRLVGVCGAGVGPSVARPVRAAGSAVAAGATVDVGAARALGGDLAGLARLLRDAGRG